MGYRRIARDVRSLRDREIKIGFWGNDSVDGVAVTDYAMYNEFGTSRGIPARPFMAKTYDDTKGEVEKFIDYLASRIFVGLITPDHALRVLGEQYTSKLRMTIRNAKEWAVPNAPSTIAMKGSSSPLIDTGRMVGSVRYEIT